METSTLISIASAAAALVGAVISSYQAKVAARQNQFSALNAYLSKFEEKEFIEARKHVYNTANVEITDEQVSQVVNFYSHWGLLAKHGYLPMWVFLEEESGNGELRLYERVSGYIDKMRTLHNDPHYAQGYEWLIERLKKIIR